MKILAADLFCGAGGTSSGLLLAAKALRREVDLLAVNHWNVAIDTHLLNHPGARHLCESLDGVDPRKVIPGGRLDLLCASPECTHHSIARGGKPRSDQSRATAWHILRWAEALRIENVLIENVKEFQTWGPLTKRGQPMKRRKGETFRAFINALQSLGYQVEHRVLNAADYGDATTRHRLFIIASRNAAPRWPAATHAGRWKPAREIIDWSIKGQSIFSRKKPLSNNTLRRIAAGLRKFGGESFIVQFDQTGANGNYVRGVDKPTFTFCTKANTCVVQPFIVNFHGNHKGRRDGDRRVNSVDKPLPTQSCDNRFGVCEPFLVTVNHGKGEARRAHSSAHPLPTLCGKNGLALIESFIVKYYATGGARPTTQPLDTISTRDRFALVQPETDGRRLEILFRMLQPHELAAAMSFPAGYQFTGTREYQVKQIGNAVPVLTAAALCKALLS